MSIDRDFTVTLRWWLLLAVCTVCARDADAGDKLAYKYYTQAEKFYRQKEFDQAIYWYRKAIAENNSDGRILIKRKIDQRVIPDGRGAKKIDLDESLYAEYIPGQRIKSIKSILLNQKRHANPPMLSLRWMSLRDPTHDNVLDGGESGTIVVNINNSGRSDALDVKLKVEGDGGQRLRFKGEIEVGDILAGEASLAEIPIFAQNSVVEKDHHFFIRAREKDGFDSNPIEVILHTRPHRPARVVIRDIQIQDLNNNQLIEPGEPVVVKAFVGNIGQGVSDEVDASIILGDNVFPSPESDSTVKIGKMFPGTTKEAVFRFLTNRRFTNNQKIPASLKLDEGGKPLVDRDLNLAIFIPDDAQLVRIEPKNRTAYNSGEVDNLEKQILHGSHLNKNAVAVVIGNQNYRIAGVPQVEFAVNDARLVKKYLTAALGYLESNIIYLEDATAARFTEVFGSETDFAGKLFNYIEPGKSEVFIYYSGHGAPDIKNKNAFFVPVDVDPAYIGTTGYALNTFYKNIVKLPVNKLIIVLDTCFSGNSDGGVLLHNISPASLKINESTLVWNKASVFTSSAFDQVSTWYRKKRHGLFTYFFIRGLSGKADQNGDGKVTSTELGRYVNKHVKVTARRLNGQEQTPELKQKKETVIVDYGPLAK